MAPGDDIGTWNENRKLVISELERCASNIHGLRSDIQSLSLKHTEDTLLIRTDIASLKTKAQVWGAVMGCVGGGLGILIAELLVKLFH